MTSISGFPEEESIAQANRAQANSPGSVGLANAIAKALGAPGTDSLSPENQKLLNMIVYTVGNNFGDSMGMLNSGNMFMGMQQAILSNQGGLIGASPGSSTAVVKRAAMLTDIAQGMYYNKNGTPNRSVVGNMDPETYISLASGAAGHVPVKGGVRTNRQQSAGSSGLGATIDSAVERGADKTQSSISSMRDVERKTAVYEKELGNYEKELKEKDASYTTLKQKQERINQLEEATGDKFASLLTDDEKATYQKNPEKGRKQIINARKKDLTVQKGLVQDEVDKRMMGREFKAEDIKGTHVGASKVNDADLSVIHDAMDGRVQFDTYSNDYKKRVQSAIRSNIRPVNELSKLFGTDNFDDIQAMSESIGFPDLVNPINGVDIATRIRHAKITSRNSGRTMRDVFNEQGILTSTLQTMTGTPTVDSGAVMQLQNIGGQADLHREKFGTGMDRMSAQATAMQAIAGYQDESGVAIASTKQALENPNRLSKSQQTEAKRLMNQLEHAESEGEMKGVQNKIRAFADQNGLLSNPMEMREASAKYGMYVANVRSGRTAAHNMTARIEGMSNAEISQYDSETQKILKGVRGGNKRSTDMIYGMLGQNGVDQEFMDAVGDDTYSDSQINKLVAENVVNPMTASGAKGEDIAKAKERYTQYMKLPPGMRQFMRQELENSPVGQTRRTRAQTAREQQVLSREGKEEFWEPKGGGEEKGGIKDMVEGFIEGSAPEKSDLSAVAGWMDEELQGKDKEMQEKGFAKVINEGDSGMAVFDINKENDTLNNPDVLEKDLGGENPVWKAMGFDSLKTAKKGARGSRLYEGMEKMERDTGGLLVPLGDDRHVVLAPGDKMKERKAAGADTEKKETGGDKLKGVKPEGKAPKEMSLKDIKPEEEKKKEEAPKVDPESLSYTDIYKARWDKADEKDIGDWDTIAKEDAYDKRLMERVTHGGERSKEDKDFYKNELSTKKHLGTAGNMIRHFKKVGLSDEGYKKAAEHINEMRGKDDKYKGIAAFDASKDNAKEYVEKYTTGGQGLSVKDTVSMLLDKNVVGGETKRGYADDKKLTSQYLGNIGSKERKDFNAEIQEKSKTQLAQESGMLQPEKKEGGEEKPRGKTIQQLIKEGHPYLRGYNPERWKMGKAINPPTSGMGKGGDEQRMAKADMKDVDRKVNDASDLLEEKGGNLSLDSKLSHEKLQRGNRGALASAGDVASGGGGGGGTEGGTNMAKSFEGMQESLVAMRSHLEKIRSDLEKIKDKTEAS